MDFFSTRRQVDILFNTHQAQVFAYTALASWREEGEGAVGEFMELWTGTKFPSGHTNSSI